MIRFAFARLPPMSASVPRIEVYEWILWLCDVALRVDL